MILSLINRIKSIENLEIHLGRGPRHPIEPDSRLSSIVDTFFRTYGFLLQDQGYISFIEMYAGMHIFHPSTGYYFDIVGFSDSSSDLWYMNGDFLWQGESSILLGDYLAFCDAGLMSNQPSLSSAPKVIGSGFAFDASGNRPWGIYRAVNSDILQEGEIKFDWYCKSFSEWLSLIIQYDGRLPYHLPSS